MDQLLQLLPCGVVSFGDDGAIIVVNATLLDLLGYEHGELEGQHVEVLLTVAGRILFQTHVYPLVRLQGRAEELFVLLRRKDGEDIGALVNARRSEAEGRQVIICAIMPVRERRRYEDALLRAKQAAEEANHAKSRFLAVMSHELRTPLNAIGGYVQLIDLGIHGPVTSEQRQALERIARGQSHLLRLSNSVLNLARIEAGHVDYDLGDALVSDVVAGVMPMVEPQMDAAGLTCTASITPGIVARTDPEKMQQILINVLTNAVKFTPAAADG